jgi:hypothetical protein
MIILSKETYNVTTYCICICFRDMCGQNHPSSIHAPLGTENYGNEMYVIH